MRHMNGAMVYGTPPIGTDWQPISTAPRDGTPVEIVNTYGVAPSYGLYRWTNEIEFSDGRKSVRDFAWRGVLDSCTSISGEGHIQWRPYKEVVANYVDPTGGFQNDPRYWRQAVAAKHGLSVELLEQMAAKNERANRLNEKPKSVFGRMMRAVSNG